MPRCKRCLAWLSALLLLYALLAGLALPLILRPTAERELAHLTQSPCRIGKLSFNPFTLTLRAYNITVDYPEAPDRAAEAGQASLGSFLSVASLELAPDFTKLLTLTPGIGSLRLSGLDVELYLFGDGLFSPGLFPWKTAATPAEQNENKALFPFTISGIAVQHSTVTFHNLVHGAVHQVTDIQAAVPFLSTRAADRELPVTPRLSGFLNGRRFAFTGSSQLFSEAMRTRFSLETSPLNLDDFRSYLSKYTRLSIRRGNLSSALTLNFEINKDGLPLLSMTGSLNLADLEITEPDGTTFFSAAKAFVELEKMLFGPPNAAITRLSLETPYLALKRSPNGSLNALDLLNPKPAHRAGLPVSDQTTGRTTPPGAVSNAAVSEERPGNFSRPSLRLHHLDITGGTLVWNDLAVPGGYTRIIPGITISLANFSTGQGKADFNAALGEGKERISLAGSASVSPPTLEAAVDLPGLDLAPLSVYFAEDTGLALKGGKLSIKGAVRLQEHDGLSLRFGKGELSLASPLLHRVLRDGALSKTPWAKAARVTASDIQLETASRRLTLGRMHLEGADLSLTRLKNGSLELPASPSASRGGKASGPAWTVSLPLLTAKDSALHFTDTAVPGAPRLDLTGLHLTLRNLLGRPGTSWSGDVSGEFSGRRAGENRKQENDSGKGRITFKGGGTFAPLRLKYNLSLSNVPLTPAAPYLATITSLSLSQGILSGTLEGTYAAAGNSLTLAGTLGLEHLALSRNQRPAMGCGALNLKNIRYRSRSGSSGDLALAALELLRPNLTISFDKEGKNSLQGAFDPPVAGRKQPGRAASPAAGAANGPIGGFASLNLGEFSLSGGRILFRDERFAKPLFFSLAEINAHMEALEALPGRTAPFTASARLGNAPIRARGTTNPLIASPVADMRILVEGLDLRDFSPYAERFAAHPLLRGTLNADMDTQINGLQLTMRNKITITDLTIGDKLNFPGAPDVPLQTAVSLISDLNGDINLTVPVTGRLDDPQFRLDNIAGKIFGNLALKAVTSPFSLLGGLVSGTVDLFSGGGTPDLDMISFTPGSSRIARKSLMDIASVAGILKSRPSLKVTIIGCSDVREKTALVDLHILRALQQIKYASLPQADRAGLRPEQIPVGPMINAAEYKALLTRYYIAQPYSGGRRDLSTQEMLRRIHEQAKIPGKEFTALARSRAENVRKALIAAHPSLEKRLYLGPHRFISRPESRSAINAKVEFSIR